jgi:hypothetical protein
LKPGLETDRVFLCPKFASRESQLR